MKRLTMTAVAVLTLSLPSSLAHAQNPPKSPGAEAPAGGGGENGEQPKPGAPARGNPGQPGRPAQGAQPGHAANPGEPKAGEPRAGEAKPGEAKPEERKPGEAKTGERKPDEAKPGRPGEAGKPAAARPAPHVAAAQRQQVVTRFRTINVAPVHVDFGVRIGVAVPRTVVLRPVPPEIIDVVPDFEGFRFFVVPGEIVIVDPDTFEVVEVLTF